MEWLPQRPSAKPKIVTLWPFTEKGCRPRSCGVTAASANICGLSSQGGRLLWAGQGHGEQTELVNLRSRGQVPELPRTESGFQTPVQCPFCDLTQLLRWKTPPRARVPSSLGNKSLIRIVAELYIYHGSESSINPRR